MKFISICLLFFSIFSYGDITSIEEAINKAGTQRMLSQRIVKNYIMIGSNIKATKAQQELDRSIALFEQQHLELIDFAATKSITTALERVSEVWIDFRLKAISNPTKETASILIPLSDELFLHSNKVVLLLEKKANKSSAILVNTSGKQRMLSQKIAKLYMAMAWRIHLNNMTTDFTQAMEEYEQGLTQLNQANENTQQIMAKLKKVNAQWAFSKAGFSQYEQDRFVPTLISVTSESLLKKMNDLTNDYQKLAERS